MAVVAVRWSNRWINSLILATSGLLLWLLPDALVNGGQPRNTDRAIAEDRLGPVDNSITDEIASRPPFRPSRRPAQPQQRSVAQILPSRVTRKVAPAVQSTADFTLLGTALGPDGGAALIRSQSLKRVLFVPLGEALGPWIVDDIASDRVRLRGGLSVVDLRFPAPARNQSLLDSGQFGMPGMTHFPTNIQR